MAQFGSFEFDPARRQLLYAGREVHLTPKAFDLLAILTDAAPRVVPKAELHERLWPNGIVSDATLVGLVKEVRRAFADHDSRADLIRTAHRVGYAFTAPLVHAHPAAGIWRWLIVKERRVPLAEGENLVGRDPQSAVWLDYATVSRRHARIVVSGTDTILEDLGSKNGTRVGFEPPLTRAVALRNGDRIGFGQVFVHYRESAAGLSTATQLSRLDGVSSSAEK
jgi:DNA-binding winged helix-turn-helix (wHTH) protein